MKDKDIEKVLDMTICDFLEVVIDIKEMTQEERDALSKKHSKRKRSD